MPCTRRQDATTLDIALAVYKVRDCTTLLSGAGERASWQRQQPTWASSSFTRPVPYRSMRHWWHSKIRPSRKADSPSCAMVRLYRTCQQRARSLVSLGVHADQGNFGAKLMCSTHDSLHGITVAGHPHLHLGVQLTSLLLNAAHQQRVTCPVKVVADAAAGNNPRQHSSETKMWHMNVQQNPHNLTG